MSSNIQGDFPQAILFDHDGTLVDTEPVWAAAKVELAAEFGGVWTAQDTLDCLGYSMKFTLDRLRERGVNLPDQQINDRLVGKVRAALADSPVEFLPGIERFLVQVRDAGIPAAIVTNATTAVAQRTADAAPEGTFSVVIGNDETTHPKPNPQPYLLAAQRLGVDPSQCVAIEDSPSGVRSATDAGMKVIVVPGELEVPAELGRACVKVLAAWQWGEAGRPVAVLTLPSPVRPRLAQSLGRGLASVGRLVDLGQVSLVSEPRFFGGNSAFRCADVLRSYRVPAEVLDYVREHRCPVLLVSDVVDSRWAFTVVARELRLAGASAVYPFSLAATH